MPETASMRALIVNALLPDYEGCGVAEIAVPAPGPNEVLIKVQAAGIGFPDLLMTRGAHHHRLEPPFVPGGEMAGVVAAVGSEVRDLARGDEVVGARLGGAMAEYACCNASELRRKPACLSFSEAAAYGVAYLTAYVALVRRGQLAAGEWVLVHGAAGGVGLAAVDLAKALGGRVIAASASPSKLAEIERLYAPEAVIDVRDGFRDKVKALTGGHGADLIYDPVGGAVFDESTRAIAFDGRLLVVGFASGVIPTLKASLPLIKGFSVVGVRAGEYGRKFPERGRENLDRIWALAAERRTRPHVHAEVPLADWRRAFELVDSRAAVGRVVLCPDR